MEILHRNIGNGEKEDFNQVDCGRFTRVSSLALISSVRVYNQLHILLLYR